MARAPDERITQAYELYKQGMKLVEIASQLKLPEGTVRRWKSTHKWDGERSDNKSERSGKKKNVQKERIAKEVKEVLENTELNDKQRLFCLYYSKSFNATRSYQKAYGCSYESASVNGPRLLGNDRLRSEIMRIKEERYSQALLKPEDIFQKYMDIAFSDITDFMKFGNETITVMDKSTGDDVEVTISHVNIRNDNEVDGTIISEVSKGKDGVKVKLADRMKALDWLTDHMNMATDEQKAKLGLMNAQRDKLTGNNQEIEDTSDTDGEIYGSN